MSTNSINIIVSIAYYTTCRIRWVFCFIHYLYHDLYHPLWFINFRLNMIYTLWDHCCIFVDNICSNCPINKDCRIFTALFRKITAYLPHYFLNYRMSTACFPSSKTCGTALFWKNIAFKYRLWIRGNQRGGCEVPWACATKS